MSDESVVLLQEETRARDLFYALWIPDIFMRRVEANEEWSLMCPADCPGLHDVWGKNENVQVFSWCLLKSGLF